MPEGLSRRSTDTLIRSPAERALQPVRVAQAGRELAEPAANPVRDQRQAFPGPGFVAFLELGDDEIEDRRFHGIERREHPGDRARPRVGVVRQQARMALGEMQDDRPGFEQDEIALLEGRNLAEGMQRRCAGSFIARNGTRRTAYGWPTSSSAQRTRVSRASRMPPSGDRSNAVMVIVIVLLLVADAGRPSSSGR